MEYWEFYKLKVDKPKKDTSGLWVVEAQTGERSQAVPYKEACKIRSLWRKLPQYKGINLMLKKCS